MTFDDRFARLRAHTARRHQCDWTELENDINRLEAELAAARQEDQATLAQVQAELAELLRRTPDTTPATVTVTVH